MRNAAEGEEEEKHGYWRGQITQDLFMWFNTDAFHSSDVKREPSKAVIKTATSLILAQAYCNS
eukprot:scaffold16625_cov118-Cylindrotheca_fusiformis.AAC.3